MFRRRTLYPLLAAAGLWLTMLACNLSSDSVPPTIVPRATPVPPPTIGYATLAPEELPEAASTPQPLVRTESVLVNVLNQVQPDRLYQHVSVLQNFFTRHVSSSQTDPGRGIGAAATYITDQFNAIRDSSGGRFVVLPPHEFEAEWAGVRSRQRNLIGVLGGSEVGAGIILIGAHYDSISIDYNDPNIFAPGANDNASGVAALIEIARIMSQYQPRATVMFVAFGAEEIQRAGSIAFVRDYLLPNNIKVDAMFNMDIIGSSTGPNGAILDNRIRIFSAGDDASSPSRQLARTLNLIITRHMPDMTAEVLGAGDREGRYSDHLSFSDAGYAAVRFIEGLEDNTRQHNDRDTIDALRPSYMVRATQTVLTAAMAMATGPRAPQNITLRDLGSGQRTLVWETTPNAVSYIVALRRPGSLVYDNYFEVGTNTVTWDGFFPDRFTGVAIAAQDATGLMGPLSFEYAILN